MASKRIKLYIAGIAIVAVIAIVGTWAYFAQQGDSSTITPTARPANEIVDDLNQGNLTTQQALEQLTITYGGDAALAENYLETSKPTPLAKPNAVTLPNAVTFKTQDFTVGAGYFYTLMLDLQAKTQVDYSFESKLELNFEVVDPQGNRINSSERVLADKGTFTARTSGRYSLVFDNSMWSIFNPGSIRYRVIPGIPADQPGGGDFRW